MKSNLPHIYFEGGEWHTTLPEGFDMQRYIGRAVAASQEVLKWNNFTPKYRQGFSPAPDGGRYEPN